MDGLIWLILWRTFIKYAQNQTPIANTGFDERNRVYYRDLDKIRNRNTWLSYKSHGIYNKKFW
jgi:hypothetical protein